MTQGRARVVTACLNLLLPLAVAAQQPLTLEDAIARSLDRNLGIMVAKNTAQQARNRATAGNAGLLPQVGLSSGGQWGRSTANLEFATPGVPPIDTTGESGTVSAEVKFSYVLFDGLGSIRNFRKLKLQGSISEIQERMTVEAVIMETASAFLEAQSAAEAVSIAEAGLALSMERLQRELRAQELGISNRLMLLNAQLFTATDSLAVADASLRYRKAVRQLRQAIQWEGDDPVPTGEVSLSPLPDEARLRSLALSNSAAVLLSAHNLQVGEVELKLARSQQMPVVIGQAGFGYSRMTSDVSFIRENSAFGPTLGINLSYSLFDGRKKSTQLQNAKIALETGRIRDTEAKQELLRNLDNGLDLHQTCLQRIRLTEQAIATARAAYERSSELFALGQLTGIELRDAQLSLLNTQLSSVSARAAAKMAELDLLRVSGMLLHEQRE